MSEPTTKLQNRWDEIRDIWKDFASFYELLGGFTILAILVAIGAFIFIDQFTDFSMNAFTEFISVIGTVFIVDRLANQRAERERKEELVFQMGSDEAVTAKAASRMLTHKGWLTDGSLEGANLRGVNLEGADLWSAHLEGADLRGAHLEGADLAQANLRDVVWKGKNSFTDKILIATLPDGTQWTEDTDMTRFTDRDHQAFWHWQPKDN